MTMILECLQKQLCYLLIVKLDIMQELVMAIMYVYIIEMCS